jgi:hypothetical protein
VTFAHENRSAALLLDHAVDLVGRESTTTTFLFCHRRTASAMNTGLDFRDEAIFHDKAGFDNWMVARGLGAHSPTPITRPSMYWHTASASDLTRHIGTGFPVVAKATTALQGHSKGVFVAYDAAQLFTLLAGPLHGVHVIVQKAIKGRSEVSLHFAAHHGALLDAACLKFTHASAAHTVPVRYTNESAESFATVSCDARLLRVMRRVAQHTRYHGMGCANVKWDGSVPTILEVNARICHSAGGEPRFASFFPSVVRMLRGLASAAEQRNPSRAL